MASNERWSSRAACRRSNLSRSRLFLLIGKAAVGGDVGEIEQRRAEAAVFPVDEPQTLAVVEEVAGEKIMMAEHDRLRELAVLEHIGKLHELRKVLGVRRLVPAAACSRSRG